MAINFTLISPEVDAQLARAPPAFWSATAAVFLAFGIVFAFSGSRLIRTAGFVFGAFTGALVMAIILSFTQVSGDAWLGLVIALAVLLGFLTSCIVRLGRLALVVALAFTVAMLIMQYLLSYIQGMPPAVEYSIIAVCVLACAFFAYKAFAMAMIVASSAVGGFLVLISTGYFLSGQLSPAGWWFDPAQLVSCTTMGCWGPFIAGLGVGLLGFFYQLGRLLPKLRQNKKAKVAADRARKAEAERFNRRVEQIRKQRDEKVAQQTQALREEARKTDEERKRLAALAKSLEAEKARVRQQDAEVKRRLAEAAAGGGGGGGPRLEPRPVPLQPNDGHRPPPVAVDLRALQAQREEFAKEQAALEQRNVELRDRMRVAEVMAVQAAAEAAEAERKAQFEAVKSAELEEALASERRELQKLLAEALEEKKAAEERLVALAVLPVAATVAADGEDDDNEARPEVEQERERLRERIAEAEALEDELQVEMAQLMQPDELLTVKHEAEEEELDVVPQQQQQQQPPPLPPNKPKLGARREGDPPPPPPVSRSPPKSLAQEADAMFQMALEGLALVIVTIYNGLVWATEDCMRDLQDKHVDQLRKHAERRKRENGRFSGEAFVDRMRRGTASV